MSLLSQFPEIESFFKKDSFTGENLYHLWQIIQKKYTDKAILKSAKALIQLEIVKFQLQNKQIYFHNSGKENILESSAEKKSSNAPSIIRYNSITVLELSTDIRCSVGQLISILNQKNIRKEATSILETFEIKMIEPFINSRREALKRHEKHEQRFRESLTSEKRLHSAISELSGNDVYTKISLHGFGKLIYIRSK